MELPPSVQYLIFPWKQIEIGLRPCLWVRMLALSPPSASLEFQWLKVLVPFALSNTLWRHQTRHHDHKPMLCRLFQPTHKEFWGLAIGIGIFEDGAIELNHDCLLQATRTQALREMVAH